MILTPNNKISSMAKDFGVKNKTITDLLAQNGIEGKNHSSVLSPEEFSLVFEALTAQAQITNMAEYLGGTADIPRPEEEAAAKKKAEEEKAAAEAAKKAAEEEQKRRAAAEAAGDHRLFPIMQRGPRGKNMIRHLAEAALPCRPVDAAGARAERAVTIIQHKTQLQSSSCLPV